MKTGDEILEAPNPSRLSAANALIAVVPESGLDHHCAIPHYPATCVLFHATVATAIYQFYPIAQTRLRKPDVRDQDLDESAALESRPEGFGTPAHHKITDVGDNYLGHSIGTL